MSTQEAALRRRKALVAELLDPRAPLFGVALDDLVDDEALAADDERGEGLDEGAEADYAGGARGA